MRYIIVLLMCVCLSGCGAYSGAFIQGLSRGMSGVSAPVSYEMKPKLLTYSNSPAWQPGGYFNPYVITQQ